MIQYIPFLIAAVGNTQSIPNNLVPDYNLYGYSTSVVSGAILSSIDDYTKTYSLNISNSFDAFTIDDDSNVEYKFEVLVSTSPVSNNINFNSDVTNLDHYVDNSFVVLYDELTYNVDLQFYEEYYIYYDISFQIPNFVNILLNNQTLYFYWSISTNASDGFSNSIVSSANNSWAISTTSYSMGVEYDNGFTNGFSQGSNEGYNKGYNDGYDSRQSTIDNLQTRVDNLEDLVEDYREGRISLESLMWTIASLPFESFKQIWNVELLGVNLGGFALGLMFVGIVLFIWKKFI